MVSALKKVKETLGPDALILSTRTVRKGGLGILGKPILEVTAAVEPATAPGPSASTSLRKARNSGFSARDGEDDLSYDRLLETRHPPLSAPPRARFPLFEERPNAAPAPSDPALASIRGEIDELKTLIQGLVRGYPAQEQAPAAAAAPVVPPSKGRAGLLATVMAQLTGRGIEAEAAETIGRHAVESLSSQQLHSPGVLNAFFEDTITDLLQVSGPLFPRRQGQKRIALIGPTGVGKTTTIAKLAADFLMHYGQRVALVTIDTYRIAAVEQLKVYGEIMDLPVEVVMSPEQLQRVFLRHHDKELILIDTAGRSPKDEPSLKELSAFLHPDFKTENHLVLSATTRESDLDETIRRFRHLRPASLLFTKLDECGTLGTLLNVHIKNNYPLSYLTNGQRVPEDMLLAEPRKVAGLILGQNQGRK